MPENTCLNADQLKSFALGRLDDLQTELVSQHLKDCPNCEETLSGFDDTNDSLLLQIRTAQPPAEDSPAQLEAALAGIAALHSDGQAMPTRPSETLNKGTQPQAADDWVRDYRLIGKLGQGGMGTVYKAVHERLQRTVAIKLLPARRLRNREAIGRFEREMQAIGRLDHPAIVRATDAGEVDGTHFLAMEYVNGIDLGKVVRLTGPLSIPNACEVIRVVATGLSYAHEQGLIHRDVKPSNIMLVLPDGGGEANVKLLDLGLALFGAASEAVDDFTTVGQLMGTLDYMAPEQADHSHVNATADVYSLGATLFKLLTGKAPFETREFQSPLQKMKALATMTAPSLHDRRPETPPSLVAIADQLLQRDPADRMSSAAEVSEAMQPFCEGHNLKQLAEQAVQQQALEDAKIETEVVPSAQPSIPSAMLKSPQLESGVKPVVASASGTNNNRWKRWLAASAAAPLLAFLGAIIWIQTDRGTLKIESVANDVPIEIRQGKELVDSFTLKSGPNEISLRSGHHEVKIAANYDQLQMSNNKVEIQRGGEAIVRVEHVAEGVGSLFRSSGPSQGKSASSKKTPDPLGLDPEEWLADYDRATYRVGSGDLLAVYVKQITAGEWAPASRDKRLPPTKGQPSLILDDGQLHMPCVNVSAALLTVDEIERKLYDAYRKSDVILEGTQVVVNVLERRTTDSEKFVTGYRSEVGDTLAILIEEPHNPSGPKPDWRLYTKAAGLPACILGDLYTIESSGNIGLPYIKPLALTGLSLSQIRSAVSNALVDQQVFHEDSFSVSVGVVSSQSSEKFTQVESNEGGAGRGPIFEGRTYAEWKSILNRERSPEELTKAIEALAALSDDSNAAETCQSILEIMDRIHADVLDVTVESTVLHTGLRRIRELNARKTVPVLLQALETGSAGTCLLIIGEFCNSFSHIAAHNSRGNSRPTVRLGPVEPLRTALVKSGPVVDAALRSFPRWGIEPNRESLSYFASNVLLNMISTRRSAGQTPTPAMLKFCRQVADAGGGPESGIHRYTWVAAIFVLLETTDQKDVPELLWAHMTTRVPDLLAPEPGSTNQLVFDYNGWRSLAGSPVAIRKMLPLLNQHLSQSSGVVMTARFSVDNGDGRGGFGGSYEDRYFLRSTLIIELMGLAEKDAASSVELLRKQFQEFTGVTPSADGAYTFGSTEPSICSQLNNLDPVDEPNESHQQEARLKHIQTLLWAWEQIMGEPARFAEPQFPKLAEFPKELQPKIVKYKGKTIDEWAEYDGSDFESWEAEIARYQFLETLRTQDGLPEAVQGARQRIAEHAVLEFRDDSAWFKLVHQLLTGAIESEAVVRFDKMLETLNTAQCAQLLTECFVRLNDTTSKGLSTRLASLAVGYSEDGGQGYNPLPSQTAAISRLVLNLQRLPMRQQHEVLMRVNFWPLPLSQEAQNRVKRLSESDDELRVLATFAAARQFQLSETDREQIIDRLIEMLEHPDEDTADWVNAAMSLGVAVSGGVTEQQLRRLVAIAVDEKASEGFDVLRVHLASVYADRIDGPVLEISYKNVTEAILVSRRVLALQILEQLPQQRELNAVFVKMAASDRQAFFDLALRNVSSTSKVISLTSGLAYIQSIRPSSSTDEQVASEWAAQVLEGVGMLTQ